MKFKFCLILFLGFYGSIVVAQTPSQQDTVLYLFFEEEDHYKRPYSRDIDPETKEWIPVVYYSLLKVNFYDGYPLQFISERKDLIDTIAIDHINDYPVVKLEVLREFMNANFKKYYDRGYYGAEYFDRLQHIYLVEKDEEKGVATITEVRLDISIDGLN